MATAATATTTDESGSPAEPVLVVTDGWVIHELAETRLRHQLARADSDVVGISATAEPLEAGESFINHAARCALRPLGAVTAHDGTRVIGAVLLRAGTRHEVDDEGTEIALDQGALLTDPGAHVHDPWSSVEPIERAGDHVRPPFPRRPVVLFLGSKPDVDLADWARGMVNDLVRLEVDARLCIPRTAEGMHLSRPCLPDPNVIEAMVPDVVVTLDDATRRRLDRWWGTNRTTLVIDHIDDMKLGVELVSWRIGRAEGRLRARVGTVGRPAELATVLDRLCGGPQPVPPIDDPSGPMEDAGATAVHSIRPRPRRGPAELDIRFVEGDPDGPSSDRYAGLLDHLHAAGHRVEVHPHTWATRPPVEDADVAVLHHVEVTDELLAQVEERRRARRATVLALSPDDLEAGSPDPADESAATRPVDTYPSGPSTLRLTAAATDLAEVCGSVIAPTRAAAAAVTDPTIRRLVLPPLVTRAHAEELSSQRQTLVETTGATIGWLVDEDPEPDEVAVVAEALTAVLHDRPDLHLVVIGARGRAAALGTDDTTRIDHVDVRPHPWELNRWMTQIWTASSSRLRRTGDVSPILDADWLGLPTVLAGDHPALGLVPHPTSLTVRPNGDVDDWIGRIRPVATDSGSRLRRSHDVVRIVNEVFGPGPAAAVNRLVGWLSREHDGD